MKNVTEGLESPYTVEKCDFMDGCDCAIVEVIPGKARGMLFDTVYTYMMQILCLNWEKEVVV